MYVHIIRVNTIQYYFFDPNTEGSFINAAIRTRFWVLKKFFPYVKKTNIYGCLSEIMKMFFCVYSLKSPYRVHYFIEDRIDVCKFSYVFGPGAMINPQWLELPMSRTHFHGSPPAIRFFSHHDKLWCIRLWDLSDSKERCSRFSE